MWGFPQASVERPTWGGEPIVWFPPILGFAPVFWSLVIASAGFCIAAHVIPSRVCMTVFTVLLCLVGLCFHEFAHAVTAYKAGAEHVAESGYLTCDLLRYMDLLDIMISVLFITFGGILVPGGRVHLDDRAMRSRGWKTTTALAGPLANLALALVASVVVHFYSLATAANPSPTLPLPIVGLLCGWNALDPYVPDTCFLKAFISSSYTGERLCLLISTVLFYVILTYVPGAWGAFTYVAGAVSGLPPQVFLKCMSVMLDPLSPVHANGISARDLIEL